MLGWFWDDVWSPAEWLYEYGLEHRPESPVEPTRKLKEASSPSPEADQTHRPGGWATA